MEAGAGCLIEGGARPARGPVGILMGDPWFVELLIDGLRLMTGPDAEASTLPLRPCSSTAFLTEGCVGSDAPDADRKEGHEGEASKIGFEVLGASSSLATAPVDADNGCRRVPKPLPSLPGGRRLGSSISLDDHLSCICCAFGALGAFVGT